MNIFYVNVIEQHAGWGAEWYINRAFNMLGHLTYCVDYRQNRDHLFQFFAAAPQSDVFFLQRGDQFPIPLIKSVQVPRFFWASELVSRCRDQDRLLQSKLFQHIFMHTQACIDTVVAKGWVAREKCSVLFNGFDENIFQPVSGMEKDIEVLVFGNLTPRRKKTLSQIRKYFQVTVASAYGEELVKLIDRAKIVLNIHADEYPDIETRVFETLGCGAFLLSERLADDNPFSKADLAEYNSIEELNDRLDYYLHHPEEREMIAIRGHTTALEAHTYLHRAREIVQIMSGYLDADSKQPAITVKMDLALKAYGVEEMVKRSAEPFFRVSLQFWRKLKQNNHEYRNRNYLV